MSIHARRWITAALVRAVRTLAQTAVALIGTTAVIEAVDWQLVASGSALAAILSLLTSLAGLPEVDQRSEDASINVTVGTPTGRIELSGGALNGAERLADEQADEQDDDSIAGA